MQGFLLQFYIINDLTALSQKCFIVCSCGTVDFRHFPTLYEIYTYTYTAILWFLDRYVTCSLYLPVLPILILRIYTE